MTATVATPGRSARAPRVAPSVLLALALVLAYAVVFVAVAVSSGIPYTQWFASASNVLRAAVLPLAVGAVLLVGFLAWTRWDVFRDPVRVPVRPVQAVALVVFAVAVVVHLALVRWDRVGPGLLGAVLLAGVLVGFCEETVFRGVLLRALRDGRRSEAFCLLVTSVVFGVFHLSNLLTGSPASAVATQVVLASTTGALLYLFRRLRGLLVLGMVAHGAWDVSLFLPGGGGGAAGSVLTLVLTVVVPVLGVASMVVSLVAERRTVVDHEARPRRAAAPA